MNPIFSIIIPVYNTEQHLSNCLESALQDVSTEIVEVVCVDDKSTDGSLEILEKYQTKYPSIKILKHDINKGLSATRNTAIEASKGKYLLFLDSDDSLIKGSYPILIGKLKNTDLDALSFNHAVTWQTAELRQKFYSFVRWCAPSYCYPILSGKEFFWRSCLSGLLRTPATMWCIKRTSLQTLFKEGIYFEDELFTVQMLLKQKKVYHINDKIIFRKFRENSIMTSEFDVNKATSLRTIIYALHNLYTEESDKNVKIAIRKRMQWLFDRIDENFLELTEYNSLKEKLHACT